MNEIIISNIEPQNIIIGEGGTTGITTVYVNGVDVTVGNVAYVIVPTKTSELQNDSGYITEEQDPTVPYYVKQIKLSDITNWNNKQNQLVSGQNIKTINNESLLGSGNINVDTSYTAGTGIQITDENVINNTITSYNDLSDTPDLSNYATLDTDELLNYYTKDFLFNILPKVSDSGTNITLNNTIDNGPMKIELGATELTQDGTPTPSSPQDIHTISGSNKVVVRNGQLFNKSTALTNKLVNASNGNVGNDTGTTASDFIYIKGLTNIILSGTTVSYTNGGAFYDKNKTYVSGFNSASIKNGIAVPNNAYYVRFNTLNTAVDTTMLNEGTTALPYEPYTSQEANIDLGNIEYCKIGNYEDKFIRNSGKNLIEAKTDDLFVNNNQNFIQKSTNVYGCIGKVEPNTTYTLKRYGGNRFNIVTTNGYPQYEEPIVTRIINNNQETQITFTTEANDNYVFCYYSTESADVYVQLEKGTTATEYEPYGSNEWYIKKNIGKYTIPNNAGGYNSSSNWFYIGTSNFANINSTANTPLASTHFENINLQLSGNENVNGIWNIGTHIVMRNTALSSAGDYQTFFTNNNVIMYSPLATPTYTPITGTLANQLENIYKNMLSQKGQTNISQVNNDLPFVITATTLKDMSNL